MGMAVNVVIMGMAVGVRAVLSVVIHGVLARLKDVADDLIDLLVQFDRGEHGRSVTCGEREGGLGAEVSTGPDRVRLILDGRGERGGGAYMPINSHPGDDRSASDYGCGRTP